MSPVVARRAGPAHAKAVAVSNNPSHSTSAAVKCLSRGEVVPGGIGDAAELRRPTRGFWGDARSLAMRRPGAAAAVAWLGVVALLAAIAPLLASGHPLILRGLDSGGTVTQTTSPL